MNTNDPKWTAYLLNELNETDRLRMEAEIEASPEASAFLESLRETADQIQAAMNAEYGMDAENGMGLDGDRKERILQAAASTPSSPFRSAIPALALAASLAIAAFAAVRFFNPPTTPSPEIAEVDEIGEIPEIAAQDSQEPLPEISQTVPEEEHPEDRVTEPARNETRTIVTSLLERGQQEMEAGQLDTAKQTMEELLGHDRYNPDALSLLEQIAAERWKHISVVRRGGIRVSMDDDESGLSLEKNAEDLETEPSPNETHAIVASLLERGQQEMEAGQLDIAKKTMDEVLGHDRYNRDALTLLEQIAMKRWELVRVDRRTSVRETMADGEKAWGTRVVAIEARFLELGGGGTGGGGGQFWSEHSASGEERPGLREGRVISPSLDDFPMLRPNTFQRVNDHPLSTFSIDVDTASYSVVRSFLNQGTLPPRDAVRVEEMINYFPYDYAPPADGTPFSSSMEVAACPWNANHLLLRIGLKGREIPMEERPPLNLVYLIDVSGSMRSPNRLPLVKRALTALAHQLDERDQVAIVVYAGATGLVLPSTSGADTQAILDAINGLEARGSTAGSAGIQLAYKTALEQFREGEVNRVILCTDGDFNVGITHRGDLERFIEEKAESGVSLTVLGFGMGNIKDSTLEILSNKGNGNYAYIDDFNEARKVLVDQMLGTLVTIAKDVKIQVEFNPATVAGYRLIGYENRILQKEDFNNDEVDAGDIGAGHTVTAFYELVPAGQPVPDAPPEVDPLRYQVEPPTVRENEEELLTLKLRYKEPEGDASKLLTFPLGLDAVPEDWDGQHTPSPDFQFASAVAAYGMVLRDPAFAKSMPWERILSLAESAKGDDPHGYRTEFIRLIRNAMALPRTEGE